LASKLQIWKHFIYFIIIIIVIVFVVITVIIVEQLAEYYRAARMPALQCYILDLEKV